MGNKTSRSESSNTSTASESSTAVHEVPAFEVRLKGHMEQLKADVAMVEEHLRAFPNILGVATDVLNKLQFQEGLDQVRLQHSWNPYQLPNIKGQVVKIWDGLLKGKEDGDDGDYVEGTIDDVIEVGKALSLVVTPSFLPTDSTDLEDHRKIIGIKSATGRFVDYRKMQPCNWEKRSQDESDRKDAYSSRIVRFLGNGLDKQSCLDRVLQYSKEVRSPNFPECFPEDDGLALTRFVKECLPNVQSLKRTADRTGDEADKQEYYSQHNRFTYSCIAYIEDGYNVHDYHKTDERLNRARFVSTNRKALEMLNGYAGIVYNPEGWGNNITCPRWADAGNVRLPVLPTEV